jgi:hypothetical protein
MSDVIDLTTRKPRPPDLEGAGCALDLAIHKATCHCAALRALLLLNDVDEFVVMAKRNLAFELLEHLGDAEAAWHEVSEAITGRPPAS